LALGGAEFELFELPLGLGLPELPPEGPLPPLDLAGGTTTAGFVFFGFGFDVSFFAAAISAMRCWSARLMSS
jgi:hypothetical protein